MILATTCCYPLTVCIIKYVMWRVCVCKKFWIFGEMNARQAGGGRAVGRLFGWHIYGERVGTQRVFLFLFFAYGCFFYVCACTMSFTNTCKEITQLNGSH